MADLPPSYESTIATMKKLWEEFPQDKRIDYYQKSSDAYKKADNRKKADNMLDEVGDKAISTDASFDIILKKLREFANRNGNRYPELETEYVPGWEKLYNDWTTAFQASQDYAAVTASEYKDRWIGVILNLVKKVDLKSPESVREEQARLIKYSEEGPPTTIPVDYENAFEQLRKDVIAFQEKFEKYLKEKGRQVSKAVEDLEKDLKSLVARLDELNKAVDDWTIALAATSWVGMIGPIITGIGLAIKSAERNSKEREVKGKQAEIEVANRAQADLEQMVTDFRALSGDFDSIKGTLQCLTQIWRDMHVSSLKFTHLLERAVNGGDDEKEFKLALKAAKNAAEPVYSSLSKYASKVRGAAR